MPHFSTNGRNTQPDRKKKFAFINFMGYFWDLFPTWDKGESYMDNRTVIAILTAAVISGLQCASLPAQVRQPQEPREDSTGEFMPYTISGRDTIYIGEIQAAKVYEKLPRQKGREWRRYYRLVYNFSKVYPYALVARDLVAETDSTIAAEKMKRGQRERYIDRKQKELFDAFEKPMRNLTVSQGALLMRLIDREVGKSSYMIIRDYKNGMAAGFWQGIARIFGSDLKKPYDPEGEDAPTEELVRAWEQGEFEGLYYSLFWEYPPVIELPSKYR